MEESEDHAPVVESPPPLDDLLGVEAPASAAQPSVVELPVSAAQLAAKKPPRSEHHFLLIVQSASRENSPEISSPVGELPGFKVKMHTSESTQDGSSNTFEAVLSAAEITFESLENPEDFGDPYQVAMNYVEEHKILQIFQVKYIFLISFQRLT